MENSGEMAPIQSKDIFRTNSRVYEEVFDWGGDNVTVTCDPQKIMRNLMRGMSEEDKSKIEKPVDIEFYLDAASLKKDLAAEPDEEKRNAILRSLDTIIDKIDGLFAFGAVYQDSDTTPYRLMVNVPKLVKSFTSSTLMARYMRPVNQLTNSQEGSSEAKNRILNNVLNIALNHEAEHVIQLLDPTKRAEIEASLNKTQNIQRAAIASVLAGIGTGVANEVLCSNNELYSKLPIAAIALGVGGGVLYCIGNPLESQHEKEAHEAEIDNPNLMFSPFDISVQKKQAGII